MYSAFEQALKYFDNTLSKKTQEGGGLSSYQSLGKLSDIS